MKRSVLIILVAATLISCNDKEDNNGLKQMTMTAEVVTLLSIQLAGSGPVTINWGDGSASETFMLANNDDRIFSDITYYYNYDYNNPFNTYTITIAGENIIGLNCHGRYVSNLDVSNNTLLRELMCQSNKLTNLDLSKNTKLEVLSCNDNQLTNLDVSKNTKLEVLYCHDNQLTNLDVSKNRALHLLHCNNNRLTSLNVKNNTALTLLYCPDNQLLELDVDKNTLLEVLNCSYNQLTNLNIKNNTALTDLSCGINQLKNLDATKNIALSILFISGNQFGVIALNTLFETLHSNAIVDRLGRNKIIFISENPGSDDCDRNIAEGKGWTVW